MTEKHKKYDHIKIEKKWRKKWARSKTYRTNEDSKKPKYYVLDMFPYLSGEGLHVGHPKGYIATDIVSRYKRMNGYLVLHPMGFDAFGLPAENYALKTKIHPEKAVRDNVARFKEQLEMFGFDYDWSREVNTSDPAYYKWTQWIFLQMFKKGLAYQSYEPINWCPSCKTGLANEDLEGGRCERCGTPVEKKPMRQWMLKITDYADRLLSDLDLKDSTGKALLDWPEYIKESQRNWIGRSEGAEIEFRLSLSKKRRFVLIHGFEGSVKTNFFPWLKRELEKQGHEVEVPELPNSLHPRESEQVEYVLKNCHFDEQTVVVGHSLGAIVAIKAIMKLNRHISGLVLVAPAVDPRFHQADSRPFSKDFNWDFDYGRVQTLTDGKIAVLSDTQEKFRMPYLKNLSQQLSARLVETKSSEEHFCAEEEPEILKAVTPSIAVFTTRPDTIFGATYLVLAPEHPWVQIILPYLENKEEIKGYISLAKNQTDIERSDVSKEKTGVELKGIKAINPANNEEIPVWIADYVLPDYGTGAIMAVPAHDHRDWEFAKKYHLPIKDVVIPTVTDHTNPPRADKTTKTRRNVHAIVYNPARKAYLTLKWKKFPWNTVVLGGIEDGETALEAAIREIREETGFVDLEFKKILGGPVEAKYFATHKDENRTAITTGVYFEMKSEKKVDVSEEERKAYDIVWKDPKDFIPEKMTNSELPFWLERIAKENQDFTGNGILIDSMDFNGKDSQFARKDITKFVSGHWVTKYKLRDWVFSRQRYWGEPIPLIHCEKCGIVPVPEKNLPVKLPKVKHYEPTGTGESPLAAMDKWVNVKCPKCGGSGKRETNTMPQWAGSSWYYLRYIDPKNKKRPVDSAKEKYWSPIDLYVGGAEHATRHLIYARFWHKFLLDIGVVSLPEPFKKLQNVGLIMGADNRKMGKRFGNIVNPEDVIKKHGADTLRVHEMFMGPFDQETAWDDSSIVGSRRFVERVWRLGSVVSTTPSPQMKYSLMPQTSTKPFPLGETRSPFVRLSAKSGDWLPPAETADVKFVQKILHKTIKKVSEDIQAMRFNTAISSMMISLNQLEKSQSLTRKEYEIFLKLLAPFAPHITEELWISLGNKDSVHVSAWPEYEPILAVDEEMMIAVQVNGKVRGSFKAMTDTNQDQLKESAQQLPEISKWISGKTIVKVIVIPKRLVNIVISDYN